MKNASTLNIDLNEKDKKGWTGFHWAVNEVHFDVIKIFIENAATLCIDLNAETKSGKTAFHMACDRTL